MSWCRVLEVQPEDDVQSFVLKEGCGGSLLSVHCSQCESGAAQCSAMLHCWTRCRLGSLWCAPRTCTTWGESSPTLAWLSTWIFSTNQLWIQVHLMLKTGTWGLSLKLDGDVHSSADLSLPARMSRDASSGMLHYMMIVTLNVTRWWCCSEFELALCYCAGLSEN